MVKFNEAGSNNIACLVSQYPKISHSFIRREILGLESRGWRVLRLSIRAAKEQLIDPEDILESGRTLFILKAGLARLLIATLARAIRSPRRFSRAVRLAFRMMRWSDRPAMWHLIYLAEACWIVPRLWESKITHLHAHFGTNPAEVAMFIGELAGLTYSFTVHGPEEYDRARCIHLAEKVKRAAFVIAVCSYGRSQIFRIIDPQMWPKIKVVHCGVDSSFGAITAVMPQENNRLVCVGRLCEQKGQLLLVKALSSLSKEGRKFELVLVGDGEHRVSIEDMIRKSNLTDCVRITGWATGRQVKEEILKARALILPSFAEGLPIVLVEAMILGRPVLSTYIAGIPELVIDGKAGWLFPAGSEKDLIRAICACLDAPKDVLKEMGEFARARALVRHSLDGQTDRLSHLFKDVLQRQQEQYPG